MKRRHLAAWLVCLGTALLIACPALTTATARADAVVLTVKGPTGTTRSYTLRQLKSNFTAYTGYAGYVKSGFVGMQAPRAVKGVRLLDVLAKVGYKSGSVTLKAADGYKMVYSSKKVHGKNVTMYKASSPNYPVVTLPKTNPLTAILAYQEKKAGAHTTDSNPWKAYTSTYTTDGSDGIGPLRFWWAYRKWANPGYVQIGMSSMRMVKAVTAN